MASLMPLRLTPWASGIDAKASNLEAYFLPAGKGFSRNFLGSGSAQWLPRVRCVSIRNDFIVLPPDRSLIDKGDKTVARMAAILEISGQLLGKHFLLVQKTKDEQRYQEYGDRECQVRTEC